MTRADGANGATRVVLLGMRCAYTEPVLEALLADPRVELRAVVLPAASSAGADFVAERTRGNGIPVLDVTDQPGLRDPNLRATLETINPDLIVVACFPWRIPAWLRTLPGQGCVNIHPSSLPDGHGPDPMFWAFRWGLAETGVTLHLVDAGLDTGPVLGQLPLAIPDRATLASLERSLAALGAEMLLDLLPALGVGMVPVSPQAPSRDCGRHAPTPRPDDLVVPTSWPARHAARFVQAVAPTYGPVPALIEATGQRLAITAMLAADDTATMTEPIEQVGLEARIRFTPGVVTARLHAPSQPLHLGRQATGNNR